MNDNLKLLIDLQKIDSRLLEIEESKGDLPAEVEQLNREINNVQGELEGAKNRIEEIGSEVRKLLAAVDDDNEKLKKLNDQLYLVKSNKEHDALNAELDHLKETITNSENKIIELEQEKETIISGNEDLETQFKKMESSLEEKTLKLNITIEETQKEEAELNKLRIEIVKKINANLLSNYDRLRKSRDGLGIVNIFSGACSACYTQLPRQTVIEVKQNTDIISCPSCSIYLFFEENFD